jgi:hypothetical protein
MNPAKADAQALIEKLPEDCTMEDIQYHLFVLEKIRNGTDRAQQSTLTMEQAEERLSSWLPK